MLPSPASPPSAPSPASNLLPRVRPTTSGGPARRVGLTLACMAVVMGSGPGGVAAQEGTGPSKEPNFLPHMTRPEVEDLLTRTDMVILPITSLEQHGLHLPIGTDYYSGVERAKRIARRVDVLVAPILFPGQSPYHMEFAGTVTLPSELIQEVYVEAAKSLIEHGFRRILVLNSHGGNAAISTFVVDRINQETNGIAVDLGAAAGPFTDPAAFGDIVEPDPPVFDRHGGVSETSRALYLMPDLVDMEAARPAVLTLPPPLERMLPDALAGDRTALTVLLAEGLKAEETGKGTSAAAMSSTGVWGARDPREATEEEGRIRTEAFIDAAVGFITRWNELRPLRPTPPQ